MNSILAQFQQNIGKSFADSPSPVAKWLNGTLVAAQEGSLSVSFEVRQEMCNPMMILHGGMVATMMDDLMGATIFTLGVEYFYTTINLSIDFLKSARIGETVTVTSQIIRQGRSVINCECRAYNTKQELLAKSMSNLIKTEIKI